MATPSQKPQWPIGQNSVLGQCSVYWDSVLYTGRVQCSVAAVHYIRLQCRQDSTVQCNIVESRTVLCRALQCSAVLCAGPHWLVLQESRPSPSPSPNYGASAAKSSGLLQGVMDMAQTVRWELLARGLPLPPGQVPHLPLQRGQPPGGGAPTVHRHAGQGEEARREESDQVKAN